MKNNYHNFVNDNALYPSIKNNFSLEHYFEVEYRKIVPLSNFNIKYFNWDENKKYFYLSSSMAVEPKINYFKEIIPEQIINNLKNIENYYVVCASEYEGYTSIVNSIYNYLIIELKIPEEKIIYISNNSQSLAHVKKCSAKYSKREIKTYNTQLAWNIVKSKYFDLKLKNKPLPKTLEHKEYKNKFLSLNSATRLHRSLLIPLLYFSNLIDKGHISLLKTDWSGHYPKMIECLESDQELKKLFQENKNFIFNIKEKYLDTSPGEFTWLVNLYYSNIDYNKTLSLYENTYFSLVTETLYFEEHNVFITEKIFKPILYKHPFIALAGAYSLKHLRELGFKTFHPYIDESYDDEPDNIKRLKMVIKETERLCNLSNDDLQKFVSKLRVICNYNQQHFLNAKPKLIYNVN